MGMPRPLSASGVAGAKFGPRGLGYWDWVPLRQGLVVQEMLEALLKSAATGREVRIG